MTERRTQPRVIVHCKLVVFLSNSQDPIITETENISARGFYCYLPHPFPVGEELRCSLIMPISGGTRSSILRMRARVVRSEAALPFGYGVACVIEDYSLETKVPY